MGNDLTLPGSIPGLLTPGSHVLHRHGMTALVLSVDDGTWGNRKREPSAMVIALSSGMGGRYAVDPLPLADLSLIMDPAGRDRAARWAAAKLGAVVGATAPRWEGIGEHRWYLGIKTGTVGIYTTPDEVPALASISLASPTADVEALIAVVLHLAGVPNA